MKFGILIWMPLNSLWPNGTEVNLGTGNGLLPNGTNPLPEPMLTYHPMDQGVN